jgi:protein required for attachment to host cells
LKERVLQAPFFKAKNFEVVSVKKLILIANSEHARFVQVEKNHYEVIEEREHPESKEKVGHLVSDRPGRTFSRVSTVRHSLGEGKDILNLEREKFAREVVRACEERHRLHPFDELWIVAGPQFLGQMRPFLDGSSSYRIREIHKEISPQEPLQEMMGKIHEWVQGNAPRKGQLWKSAS